MIHNNPYNKNLARKLRASATKPEQIMWHLLRARQLNQHKFRRQYPIGQYVVDFYCDDLQLIVEVDGDVHALDKNSQHDKKRQTDLEQRGYVVFRVHNDDVYANTDGVMEALYHLTLTLSSRRGNGEDTKNRRPVLKHGISP